MLPVLLGAAVNLIFPVIVDELKKKLAEKRPGVYNSHKEIPTSEVAVQAVKVAVVGTAKSKTGWLGLAVVTLGYLEVNHELLTALVPAKWQGYVLLGIGAASFIIRGLTSESLVEKTTPKE